jgi:hypothetical protein
MSEIPSGAMRFNSDSQKLEYWNGSAWFQVHTQETLQGSQRLLVAGASNPGPDGDQIEFLSLSTFGTSVDFGNLTRQSRHVCGNVASPTRGCFGGGYKSGTGGYAAIDFVTITTLGNAQDFGDRAGGNNWSWGGCSDATRGLWIGGTSPVSNKIDFITIASTGNTTSFGTSNVNTRDQAALASQTRAVFGGSLNTNTNIDYVTIQSTGNSIDFGSFPSQTGTYYSRSVHSNGVRGVFGPHGMDAPRTDYQFITIATLGDTQDFGDCVSSPGSQTCGASGKIRGFTFGETVPATFTGIEYINIASAGNATDFGDLTTGVTTSGCLTNCHGGL